MKYERIPYITQLYKVEPFKVTCLWNTGEVRVIDFEEMMKGWRSDRYELMYPLFEYDTFKHVSLGESGTLQWANVPLTFTFDGQTRTEPLDLDPIVLYETSKPLSAYRLVPVEQAA